MRLILICGLLLTAALPISAADSDARRSKSAQSSADAVLKDLDGRDCHPLETGSKIGAVLFFYWHDCPACNSYAPELNRISAAYTNFASYLVQIDSDLTVEVARKHAREYSLGIPVLLDPQHRLVELVGATVTPEAFVFGKKSQLLYHGRIDDLYVAPGKRRQQATKHDLRAALDAISAGKEVPVPRTNPIGCVIPAAPKR